jgi:hypothetical protein
MATSKYTQEQVFDKLTKALMGIKPAALTKAIQGRLDALSPVEAKALYLAHWALNVPEGEGEPEMYPEYQNRSMDLMERATTSREWAFVNWADCCLEVALN